MKNKKLSALDMLAMSAALEDPMMEENLKQLEDLKFNLPTFYGEYMEPRKTNLTKSKKKNRAKAKQAKKARRKNR
jgi:hypothetical protein